MYQTAYNIEIITFFLALLALIFARGKENTLYAILILYAISIDLCSKIAIIELPDGNRSNHYYYNLARIPEILFIIYTWRRCMGNDLHKKYVPLILSVGWLCFALINLFFVQGLYILNTGTFLLASAIIISLSAIFLFATADKKLTEPLLKVPGMWFWTGLLISNAFSFTYRVFEPLTRFGNSALFQSSVVVGAIIKYLFISIAFILMLQKRFSTVKNGQYHNSGA